MDVFTKVFFVFKLAEFRCNSLQEMLYNFYISKS